MCHSLMRLLLFTLLFSAFTGKAGTTTLSERAKMYLVTCGPGQNELYSAFGHTAIRVQDPLLGIDLIFNYGVFDFDQPNFYLNFAKGNLLYQLALNDYQRFYQAYVREGRFVYLQELNFDQSQKQAYFDFLEWNARPENRPYYYDYFYDNCATRPRDGMVQALQTLGQEVVWDTTYAVSGVSIRDLCEEYLQYQPWGDLGIDICLGLPMDKEATPLEYTFLPDYLAKAADEAWLIDGSASKKLVSRAFFAFEATAQPVRPWFTPTVCFSLLLCLGILLSFIEQRTGRVFLWFDKSLFSLAGLIGWLLLLLWFFTDHTAAARNMNLLWAIPLYFPTVLFLQKKSRGFSLFLMRFSFLVQAVVLVGWFFWPQALHPGLFPLCALLLWRSFWRVYRANRQLTVRSY